MRTLSRLGAVALLWLALSKPLLAQVLPVRNQQLSAEDAQLCRSDEGRRVLAHKGSPEELAAEADAARRWDQLRQRSQAVRERYEQLGVESYLIVPPPIDLEEIRFNYATGYCEAENMPRLRFFFPEWMEIRVGQLEQQTPAVLARISAAAPGANGPAAVDFPPNTYLRQYSFSPLTRFEGQWINGHASGQGVLKFVEFTAIPFGSTEGTFRPNYFLGSFKDGLPDQGRWVVSSASATLEVDENSKMLDGRVVFEAAPASPSMVRLMQYPTPTSKQPSRMFFGEYDAVGSLGGQWVDLPWYNLEGGIITAGYGSQSEVRWPDGGSQSCTGGRRSPDSPTLLADYLSESNDVDALSKASIDTLPLGGVLQCTSTSADGWKLYFTIDNSREPPALKSLKCEDPSGHSGKLINGGRGCEEKGGREFDVFTNIGREFRRFVDRRIIGTINRAAEPVERAMCRATGTEPGVNCNVSVQIGASWPVGEGAAPGLPAEEQAARQAFLAAAKRANRIASSMSDSGAPGEVATLAASANAMCAAVCATETQRSYSADLLAQLEAVAESPVTDDTVLQIRSINRSTASVLGAGFRLAAVAAAVKVAVPFYNFVKALQSVENVSVAIDLVHESTPAAASASYLSRQRETLRMLEGLRIARLQNAAISGVELNSQAIRGQLAALSGIPPSRRVAILVAISVGRTHQQVKDFLARHSGAESEEELQEALIKEALDPLGIEWPPR